MDQSRMIRWAKKGAQYGFVAAGGLAGLGVMLGPRSMVLPIAGGAAGLGLRTGAKAAWSACRLEHLAMRDMSDTRFRVSAGRCHNAALSFMTRFDSLLRIAVRFLAALAALVAVHAASAQTGVTWAMDASFGLTRGVGGEFGNRSNPLAETAVSFRRDMRAGFGIDAEVGYDWSANINNELCLATPPGRCLPDFPAFSGPLGLFGIALGAPSAIQLRLNAGFAAYVAHTTRLGAPVAAMDVSVAPSSWLAIVAGGRAFVLPNYLGDRLMVTTWRLGLRLQSIQ